MHEKLRYPYFLVMKALYKLPFCKGIIYKRIQNELKQCQKIRSKTLKKQERKVFNRLEIIKIHAFLFQNAYGYENGSISSDDFFAGKSIAEECQHLYNNLKKANCLNAKLSLSESWVRYTLGAVPHYHHLVGPAMLAAAESNKDCGNDKEALSNYEAIIDDFKFIAEDWVNEEEYTLTSDDEDYISLQCLNEALQNALEMKHLIVGQSTIKEYQALEQNIRTIFSRLPT